MPCRRAPPDSMSAPAASYFDRPSRIHVSCCRAGAHLSWFHLYRVLMLAPAPDARSNEGGHGPAPVTYGNSASANGNAPGGDASGSGECASERARRSAAVAVEQFVQTAPLGEFERRLELLASFRRALR